MFSLTQINALKRVVFASTRASLGRGRALSNLSPSIPSLRYSRPTTLLSKPFQGVSIRSLASSGHDNFDESNESQQNEAGAVVVDENNSDTLFIANLAWEVSEDDIWAHFGEHGTVKSVRLPTHQDSGRPKGFGYVAFESHAEAAKALESLTGTEIAGRELRLDFSVPRERTERRPQNEQKSEPSKILFVGNLAWEASEEDLWSLFGEYGEITSVRIPKYPESGRAKGYGYVEFTEQSAAQKALEAVTGHELSGRPIRLDYSTPRDPNSGGGGGGYGGGRGGGYGGGRGGGRGGYGSSRSGGNAGSDGGKAFYE